MNILLISSSNNNNADVWIKQTLSEFLDHHIDVYQSTDYETAIEQLDNQSIDSILINNFPASQSLQLLEKIIAKYPNMPIIVLAEVMDMDMARRALTAGALDYLVKAHETPALLAHSIRFTRKWKKAQGQLQQLATSYEGNQRTTPIGSWEINVKTGEGHWSDEFYRICGLEPGSKVATVDNGIQLIHPDDRERARAMLRQAIEDKTRYDIINRIVRADGEIRYVHSQGDIIKDGEQGDARLIGASVDITERIKVEEEIEKIDIDMELRVIERTNALKKSQDLLKTEIRDRKEAQALLRQENEFISTVLDTVSALVVVLDNEGNIVGFNHAAELASGYSSIDVDGKSVWEYFIPADEMESARAAIDGLSIGKQSSTYQGHWLTRNGSRMLIDWTNTILHDESGQAKYIICSGIDVTDSAHMQEADKRHMLDLFHLSRLSTMGEMATEIAHELNQPLAAIVSFSDSCKRILDNDDWELHDVSSALKEINRQANRAGEIIRELRRFANKQETHRSSVDINQLVKEVAHLIEIETRYHHISLEMDLSEHLPLVMANRILIEQVILNLVRNAIEAMATVDHSNRSMRIVVSTKQNGMVNVSVSDSGPGISPQSIGRVFEPFYTTKKDGTGMGLSICKSIINIHNGELWVTNNIDGGVCFHFSLPAGNKDD